MCAGVKRLADNMVAATPLICGHAIDVPVNLMYPRNNRHNSVFSAPLSVPVVLNPCASNRF